TGHVARFMKLDPVIRNASRRWIEIRDGPADAAHLADAGEVGAPDLERRKARLDRGAESRAGRRIAAALLLHVAEVVLVQNHAVVLEAEAARQLGVGGQLL